MPYLVQVTEVDIKRGQEQPGAVNEPEEGYVNQEEQRRRDGQMSEHDDYYEQQDHKREQGIYQTGQDIAQHQYLTRYVDPGYQAGLADDGLEAGVGAGGEEIPGHYAHQQVYGEILLLAVQVSEDEVQDACHQKRAEQRPEKTKGGILVAVLEVNGGQVPD